MRRLIEKDLELLNLIVERDPHLGGIILARLGALEAALGVTGPQAPAEPTKPRERATAGGSSGGGETDQAQTLTAELEAKVLDWFKAHPGKHALAAVRKDLGVAEGSKPFKSAVLNLIGKKAIKSSGKRGKGAEYWLG